MSESTYWWQALIDEIILRIDALACHFRSQVAEITHGFFLANERWNEGPWRPNVLWSHFTLGRIVRAREAENGIGIDSARPAHVQRGRRRKRVAWVHEGFLR